MCQSLELDQSVQQKFHRTREELSNALVERDQEVDLLLTSLICKENPVQATGFGVICKSSVINLKSAEFINNPVAKEEAITKASGELRTVKKSLAETIGREGITDWVAFCELTSSNLVIKLQILAQAPAANNSKVQPRLLSEEFEFDISVSVR